jgi:hypothetical protein
VDGWWDEIEREIDQCLRRHGDCTPAELGQQLGMSDGPIASLICVLAAEGKVRIARVAAGADEAHGVAARAAQEGGMPTLPVLADRRRRSSRSTRSGGAG